MNFKILGENIKATRSKRKLTQNQLAHKIGYTGPGAGAYISRLESGKNRLRTDTLARLATALGTTASALLKWATYQN